MSFFVARPGFQPQALSEAMDGKPPIPISAPIADHYVEEERPMNAVPKLPQASPHLSTIHQAVTARVDREMAAVEQKIAHLEKSLSAFRELSRVEIERRVTNAVLASLGEPVVSDGFEARFRDGRDDLQLALWEVDSLLKRDVVAPTPERVEDAGGDAEESEGAVEDDTQADAPETVALVEAAPAPANDALTVPPSSGQDYVDPPHEGLYWAELRRRKGAATAKWINTSLARLTAERSAGRVSRAQAFHWLQGLTAEVRILSALDGLDHPAAMIPRLSAERKAAGLGDVYIHGLAFSAQGEWPLIAEASWSSLAIGEGLPAKPLAGTPKANAKANAVHPRDQNSKLAQALDWPELPRVRRAIELRGPVLMVGGRQVQEKVDLVQKRYGIAPEWCEVEDAPRSFESVVSRIRSGTTAGVLLVEGFSPHKVTDAVVEACKAAKIPFALTGTGGIGAVGLALNTLEDRTT